MGQILKHPIIGGMLNFDKHHYTYFTVCPFSLSRNHQFVTLQVEFIFELFLS